MRAFLDYSDQLARTTGKDKLRKALRINDRNGFFSARSRHSWASTTLPDPTNVPLAFPRRNVLLERETLASV